MKKFINAFKELRHYKKTFGREMKVNLVWLSREDYNIERYEVFFGYSDRFLTNHLKTEIVI